MYNKVKKKKLINRNFLKKKLQKKNQENIKL